MSSIVPDLSQQQVWFLTGSQHLYGEETLRQVAAQSQQIAETIDASTDIPVSIVWKPILADSESIRRAALDANADDSVIGSLADCIEKIQTAFDARDHHEVRDLTTAFYERMFQGGRRNVAWEVVQSLTARINRLRALTIASDDRGRQAVEEMRQILAAIRAKEPAHARDAARAHVERVAQIAQRLLGEGHEHAMQKRAG